MPTERGTLAHIVDSFWFEIQFGFSWRRNQPCRTDLDFYSLTMSSGYRIFNVIV